MKYTRFRDIPQFTRGGAYNVNVPWDYLEHHLAQLDDARDMGNALDLDPDYQRCHVWTEEKQRGYVEYVLRGGKSSRLLHFNCSSWQDKYDTPIELVDGKQRLEAVRKFLRDELIVFGDCLNSMFTDKLGMCGPDFVFSVNNLKTRAEVLQWYLDLNTGGVVHTSEEIEKVKRLLQAENAPLRKVEIVTDGSVNAATAS